MLVWYSSIWKQFLKMVFKISRMKPPRTEEGIIRRRRAGIVLRRMFARIMEANSRVMVMTKLHTFASHKFIPVVIDMSSCFVSD